MSNISQNVINGWSRAGIHQFDISFFRLCSNDVTKEWNIEDEVYIGDVMVKVEFQGGNRIVSLYFDDCENRAYQYLKDSIQEAKDKASMDYVARHNSYLFHVEFDSNEEVSAGPDINVSKNQCYVDEGENRIIFICKE